MQRAVRAMLLVLPLLMAAPLVSAAQTQSHIARPLPALKKSAMTLEQAIQRVRGRYQAKVLSASEIQSRGPLVYQVKILLPNGRVRTVFVDGIKGEVFE